jgi:hypothetical protein
VITRLRDPLTAAVECACELCRLVSACAFNSRSQLMELLTDTVEALEGCPAFTPAEICYFRNRLGSCRKLLLDGEWGAARYEITEMSRKLSGPVN